jgi:hypothetical protein
MDVYVRTSGITRISRSSTAIGYTSLLAVQRGNTNVFTVRDDGATDAVAFSTPLLAGQSVMNPDGFSVRSVGSFKISSDVAAFSPDVFLRRDGPGIFSQYNGINPQQYRIYNATGTNSGEFGVFGWQRTGASGTPNAFVIGAQATQNGTLRNVVITGANINLESSGVTNFNNRPTVNGTGVLLSGEGGIVDLSLYATKIDLASTGTTLNTKMDSFSGFANDNFYLKSNPSGFVTNTNLQKAKISLLTGIETYTGTFNTVFNSVPTVVATVQATDLFNYVTTLTSVTTSGFVTDFSDTILESGVILNIIAYDGAV